jgi:glycogen debranching enzyme
VLEGVKVGFPTTPPDDPAFDAKRYWRGPSWAVMNWLLIEGLERNGLDDLAKRLRDDTLTAIARAGFAEYFDPQTGEGCGGLSISWTAAAYLCLSASEASRP